MKLLRIVLLLGVLAFVARAYFFRSPSVPTPPPASRPPEVTMTNPDRNPPAPAGLQQATFGSGCFWCTEAVFKELRGVQSAVSGYSGGHVDNPTYREVCEGTTGHAEVVQVTYDPQAISFDELLEVFWQTHDPTTLNRQGYDTGTQYRSAVFYHDDHQRQRAEHFKAKLNAENAFGAPIVTEITPFRKFYAAEDYHQDYFALNPSQRYCVAIVRPKVDKFRKAFASKLKPDVGKD